MTPRSASDPTDVQVAEAVKDYNNQVLDFLTDWRTNKGPPLAPMKSNPPNKPKPIPEPIKKAAVDSASLRKVRKWEQMVREEMLMQARQTQTMSPNQTHLDTSSQYRSASANKAPFATPDHDVNARASAADDEDVGEAER
jgi:hypothetical protein